MVLDGESWNVIPVTRYAKGMSRGLYFEEASDVDIEYCGTFYYHEPESTTLLAYKTSESFFNKTSKLIKIITNTIIEIMILLFI